ncbi:hypothetical protein CFP56_009668 [Quercus suber]|uniref:Uncharacterized protein n=1 Tax=Quercus suber TaxID=58331 RepID=A0AAW0M6F1_QUESU
MQNHGTKKGQIADNFQWYPNSHQNPKQKLKRKKQKHSRHETSEFKNFPNPSFSFPTKTNLHRQFTSLKRSNHPRHRSASPSPEPISSHRSPLYKQNSQTPQSTNQQTNTHLSI